MANWERILEILQTTFRYVRLLTDFTRKILVLVDKWNRDFIGIGLVEILWKSLSGVINWWIGAAV